MRQEDLTRILRITCVSVLSVIAGASAHAQDVWHLVPTSAPPANGTDIVGATVDAVATRGKLVSKARVVVSGQKRLGTALVGIWIERLNEVVSDKVLWPYTGPPLGPEAQNAHMIEIRLVSPGSKFEYSSRLVMLAGGNFPKGIADKDDEYLFSTNSTSNERFKTLVQKMNSGFDYGLVTIGRSVLSPPIVIKFSGDGVKGLLMPAMDRAKEKASDSSK